MALNDFQLDTIFDDAARKAENEIKPSLEELLHFIQKKFTGEAGFNVNTNSLYVHGGPLTEIIIRANNAATGGVAFISSNGTLKSINDGTFSLRFHIDERGHSTSPEDTIQQLGTFFGHNKKPVAPVVVLPPQGPFCGH